MCGKVLERLKDGGAIASHKTCQRDDRLAAAGSAELTFENVQRWFSETDYALRGVSLTVKAGEIVCLLGPSGCGKTTLLRIASGIEKPSAGRVLLNGVEVAGPNRFVPPERRNVGLMFQDFALFPHLTILQNVTFGLGRLDPAEARTLALDLLSRMGLARYASDYPHILSGGQQQRVALARAIAPHPSVVLMDEPFSGLDVTLRATIQQESLALMRSTKATCVLVTHDPEEAMSMGDRIAVMREGRITQVGTAEELFRAPADLAVARLFSDLNEISCTVKDGKVDLPFGSFDAKGQPDGSQALVCIRHRAIQFLPAGQGHPARIVSTRFLGDVVVLEIAIQGFERTLMVRGRERRISPLGSVVGIELDPAGVLVYPADCPETA